MRRVASRPVQYLFEIVVDSEYVAGQIVHHVFKRSWLDLAPDAPGASDIDQFDFDGRLVVVGADVNLARKRGRYRVCRTRHQAGVVLCFGPDPEVDVLLFEKLTEAGNVRSDQGYFRGGRRLGAELEEQEIAAILPFDLVAEQINRCIGELYGGQGPKEDVIIRAHGRRVHVIQFTGNLDEVVQAGTHALVQVRVGLRPLPRHIALGRARRGLLLQQIERIPPVFALALEGFALARHVFAPLAQLLILIPARLFLRPQPRLLLRVESAREGVRFGIESADLLFPLWRGHRRCLRRHWKHRGFLIPRWDVLRADREHQSLFVVGRRRDNAQHFESEEIAKIVRHFACPLVAIGRLLRKSSGQDDFERRGNGRVQLCNRRMRFRRNPIYKRNNRAVVGTNEWCSPGQHLVEYDPERKNVGAWIDRQAKHLLG